MIDAKAHLDIEVFYATSAGSAPPCTGNNRDFWTADSASERAAAARLCAGCPVFAACARAAASADEKWHVWAGVDRTSYTLASRRKAG